MGWQQLKEIINENKKIGEEEKLQPIVECPECGFMPLKEDTNKDLLCPICGWEGRR